MTANKMNFQQGRMLYEVVVGAFKADGVPFEHWCNAHDLNPQKCRNALYGASSGRDAQKLVVRLVEAAGREVVEVAYRRRMERHTRDLEATTDTGEAA
jgi:hypothetical protein